MSSRRRTPPSGDPSSAPAHPRLTLAATILASSLSFIDASVVNVGLPAIGESLAGGAADLQWVVNAYLLPLSTLLLLGGSLGDLFGRRRLLLAGIALFAAASALCAAAPGLGWLLAGRALQGVGAAMLLPNSLAILGAAFEGEARGRAIGFWSATGAAAAALGPVAGGALIDGVGWRAIFVVNLPIAAAAGWIAWRNVAESRKGEAPTPDVAGVMLATAGLAGVTWGLTIASNRKAIDLASAGAFLAGAALLAAFLFVERHRGDRAVMPLALFGSKALIGLNGLTFLLYGALGGLLLLVPYVLIRAGGYSAQGAGAALLPLPLLLAAASPLAGRIAARTGPRAPLTVGCLVAALGFALALRIDGKGSYAMTVLPAMVVIALGMSCAVAPLTTAVLASVEARRTGVASGFNSAVARTGGLIATALLGGVLSAEGAPLLAAFKVAAVTCAAAVLVGAACGFFLLPSGRRTPSGH